MCNWVTVLYSRKLTEHCKPATMEKNKNHYTIKKNLKRGIQKRERELHFLIEKLLIFEFLKF